MNIENCERFFVHPKRRWNDNSDADDNVSDISDGYLYWMSHVQIGMKIIID